MKIIMSLLSCALLISQEQLKVPTLSPISKITQEVGLTEISLTYSRPSAKGRKIFGDLVPFNERWRTGANASTKLTFSEDVKISGNNLPAGTYALYSIPDADEWTFFIHRNIKMRSIAGDVYDTKDDLFSFKATPIKLNHYVETFTIQFTDIHTKGLSVTLSWENTQISFPIIVEVDEKIQTQMNTLLKDPSKISDMTYFRAAEYYYHNDRDLMQAQSWIESALIKSPKNFRYGLLKAKIEYKAGQKKKAMNTIQLANQWATEKNNANYIGQTDLFIKEMQGKN